MAIVTTAAAAIVAIVTTAAAAVVAIVTTAVQTILCADREKISRVANALRILQQHSFAVHPGVIMQIYSHSLETSMEAKACTLTGSRFL